MFTAYKRRCDAASPHRRALQSLWRVAFVGVLVVALWSPPRVCSASSLEGYWLLVTFDQVNTPEHIAAIRTSSFNGIAYPLVPAYYDARTPSYSTLSETYSRLHQATQRDIWPWVFINRIVGVSQQNPNPQANSAYFHSIRGMALRSGSKPLHDFLSDWRTALMVAREIHSPGVVLDLEFYNNPSIAYAISRLSESLGEPPAQAALRLRSLGIIMGKIVLQTYPDASIWILNSALDNSADQRINGQSYFQPRGEIAIGLLSTLAQSKSAAQVIDGGEDSLGYCHANLNGLNREISTRRQKYQNLLKMFPKQFRLSGTIAVWTEAKSKRGWLNQDECASSDVKNLEGFAPYINLLESSYWYNWLYGAEAGGYRPFDPQIANRMDALITKARNTARQNAERKP